MDMISEYKNIALLSLSAIGIYALYKKITNTSLSSSHSNALMHQLHNTPLLYIQSLSASTKRNIYLKCESSLPFSHKDRVITNIIHNACCNNIITPNITTLYCAVVPSQILSYVSICKHFGFKCVLVVPLNEANTVPPFISQYQNEMCSIIITKNCPYSNFNDNYIRKAKKLAQCDPNGYYVDVYYDIANMQTHYNETGKEVYEQLKGKVDVFVCCCYDTGGTISGVSNYLKERKRDVKVGIGDVKGSGVYNYITHGVMFSNERKEGCIRKDEDAMGVGCKFLTTNIQKAKIDKAYNVSDDEIKNMKVFMENNEKMVIDDATAVNLVTIMKVIEDKWVDIGGNIVSVLFERK